jgi:hypothetical protein
MNNEPVAWMLNGILHECDPSDWAKEEYPDQDVIPLYTHPIDAVNISEQYVDKTQNNRHKLTDEEITEVFDTTFEVRDFEDSFIKFARAILNKASEK